MNKVEKIKAELERRIAEIRDISQGYIADKQMSTEYLLLHELLSYIDSLSDTEKDFGIKEELVSENTQFAQMADKYEQQVLIGEYQMKESVTHHCRLSYYLGLKDGAQWQKKQLIDKAIKWLEDNMDRYLYNTGGYGEYIPKCGGKMFEGFKKAMEE